MLGNFNPVHAGHLQAMSLARRHVEEHSEYKVIGGFLCPIPHQKVIHSYRITGSMHRVQTDEHRSAMIKEVLDENSWMQLYNHALSFKGSRAEMYDCLVYDLRKTLHELLLTQPGVKDTFKLCFVLGQDECALFYHSMTVAAQIPVHSPYDIQPSDLYVVFNRASETNCKDRVSSIIKKWQRSHHVSRLGGDDKKANDSVRYYASGHKVRQELINAKRSANPDREKKKGVLPVVKAYVQTRGLSFIFRKRSRE